MFEGSAASGGASFLVSLLDTTFFIDLYRQDSGALRVWEALRSQTLAGSFSAISAFELWVGRLSPEESAFYAASMQLLEEAVLTAAAGRRAAEMLRDLPAAMAERLIRDAMVAATAAERGETVITRNVRDFSRLAIPVETY
jgi:predicted nucleic acid-binding protein